MSIPLSFHIKRATFCTSCASLASISRRAFRTRGPCPLLSIRGVRAPVWPVSREGPRLEGTHSRWQPGYSCWWPREFMQGQTFCVAPLPSESCPAAVLRGEGGCRSCALLGIPSSALGGHRFTCSRDKGTFWPYPSSARPLSRV